RSPLLQTPLVVERAIPESTHPSAGPTEGGHVPAGERATGRASSRDSRLFGRLELPQVIPQGRARVLGTHRAPLLEQRDDLVHEGLDVARPDALADGEAVAPHRVDGPRQLVGHPLRRADVGLGVDADLAGGDVPQRRRAPGHVEAIELAADALDGPRLD